MVLRPSDVPGCAIFLWPPAGVNRWPSSLTV